MFVYINSFVSMETEFLTRLRMFFTYPTISVQVCTSYNIYVGLTLGPLYDKGLHETIGI